MCVKLLRIFKTTVLYFSHLNYSWIFFATQAVQIILFFIHFIFSFGLQIKLPPVNSSLTTQW